MSVQVFAYKEYLGIIASNDSLLNKPNSVSCCVELEKVQFHKDALEVIKNVKFDQNLAGVFGIFTGTDSINRLMWTGPTKVIFPPEEFFTTFHHHDAKLIETIIPAEIEIPAEFSQFVDNFILSLQVQQQGVVVKENEVDPT